MSCSSRAGGSHPVWGRLQVPEALRRNPRHPSVLSHVLPHLQVRGVCYKEGVSCSGCQVQLLQLNGEGRGSQGPRSGCQTSASHQPPIPDTPWGCPPRPAFWKMVSENCPPPGARPRGHRYVGPLRSPAAKEGAPNTSEPVSHGQRGSVGRPGGSAGCCSGEGRRPDGPAEPAGL